MIEFKINDILYTKDGRKSGNLTVVYVGPAKTKTTVDGRIIADSTEVWVMSDYGNLVRTTLGRLHFAVEQNQFFKTLGKAEGDHKYYNYMETHPEEFV